MANLNDLQKMAKNGEVSKKLLEDETFKNELKKILKEENETEITDEQISEIIKNFEIALQNEGILKEAELENISGGRIGKAKAVKAVSSILGASIGFAGGKKFGEKYGAKLGVKAGIRLGGTLEGPSFSLESAVSHGLRGGRIGFYGSEALGTAGGAYGGWKFGDYICKKFDIKD